MLDWWWSHRHITSIIQKKHVLAAGSRLIRPRSYKRVRRQLFFFLVVIWLQCGCHRAHQRCHIILIERGGIQADVAVCRDTCLLFVARQSNPLARRGIVCETPWLSFQQRRLDLKTSCEWSMCSNHILWIEFVTPWLGMLARKIWFGGEQMAQEDVRRHSDWNQPQIILLCCVNMQHFTTVYLHSKGQFTPQNINSHSPPYSWCYSTI